MGEHRLSILSTILFISIGISSGLRFRGETNTYAKFPIWNACINASITFDFKTTQANGLLMYTDNNGRYDFFEVTLQDGAVRLRLNVVDEQDGSVEIVLGNNLNDNRWHTVEVKRKHFETILQVDGSSSSKVAFGSDSEFRDRNRNNYVYFGGVPYGYVRDARRSQQEETVTDRKFEGDLRNILYFNCTCIPERAEVISYRGVSREPRETCEINNRCPADCPCLSVEGDSGCECKFKEACIADLYTRYHLPMDKLSGNGLVNPSGMDSVVRGSPRLVPGVVGQALELDSRLQYARIAGPSHRQECFGDLSKCPDGYFLSMWLQFKDSSTSRGIYMSNGGERSDSHGIAMYYGQGVLEFVLKHPDGQTWRVKDRNFLPKRWYHVAVSWSEQKGLHLYVDGRQVNHDARPQRGSRSTRSTFNEFILGKSNDNPRTDRLGRMVVDEFHFISGFRSAKEVRESGPIFHYYLPMDNMTGDRMETDHINARVYGGASLDTDAVLGKSLRLSGNGQYVDLGNFPGTCFGDLSKCDSGITLSFFAKFPRLDGDTRYLFSSPNGLSVYYSGNRLYADAHLDDRNWAAYYTGIMTDKWYFVEISFNPQLGLTIFLDGERVSFQPRDSHRGMARRDNRILIGKEAVSSSLTARDTALAFIDEVEVYYADREKLVALGLVSRGKPVPYHFDMERISGNRLMHDSVLIDLVGNPRLKPGKIGKALSLNGRQQNANAGQHNQICLGNLDYCQNGALFSFWIKPNKFSKNMYFASTGHNGISLYYQGRKLHAKAETSTRTWEASSGKLIVNKWQFVEASWHPEKGLQLYINNDLVDADTTHSNRDQADQPQADQDEFYMGRGNVDMNNNAYANALLDEVDYWYADRDHLTAHGYIQRGEPKHYIIKFEKIDGIRLEHEQLPIRVVENPRTIPGKIGNALQLNGNRQYADISGRHTECLGNLAFCLQGITISAWMRFRTFQNNMVFLSTGQTGIVMTYRDGYIYITAGDRSQVTLSSLETNRWYYFEISWHPRYGLQVYVDNYLEGSAPSSPLRAPSADERVGSFYIGRPNSGDTPGGLFSFGDFDIDEMDIWYGRRDDLVAFGYIGRDNFGHETFSMEQESGGKVEHPVYTVLLVNGATLTRGLIGNAASLNGRNQYVTLDEHPGKCMTELDQCTHGLTISLMLNPRSLRNGNYFLSSPAYSLYYQDGQLVSKFQSSTRSWTVSSDRIREDQWQHVTLSWHPIKGLSLYLDDVQVDSAYGNEEPMSDQPRSSTVYLGKNALNERERATANVMVDEVQFWYDDLDHLKATGQYGAPLSPQRINFDLLRGGNMIIGDRRIIVYGSPTTIQGQRYRAIFLNGQNQYVDLGQNFTCGGNLDNCPQGVTLRFLVKPERLQNGMYFIDSFPLRMYYRDGKLYAEMQTSTQKWDVSSRGLEAGRWQNIELSWHPTVGLGMYMNGQRVAHQTYPTIRAPVQNDDWRTYVGRPLVTGGNRRYANVYVENIESYNTRRDYIPSAYRPVEPVPIPRPRPRPRPTPRPRPATPRPRPRPVDPVARPRPRPGGVLLNGTFGEIVTQRPVYEDRTERRGTTKVIRFNGLSYLKYKFDYDTLPPNYYQRTQQEDLSFYFITDKPDGLLWFHQGKDGREMHISLKNGNLIFVNDEDGSPKQIEVAPDSGVGYNDWRWHLVNVRRRGRRVSISVDGRNSRDYIFENDNIQFLTLADVWVGGTPNTYELTNGVVRRNFDGGVAELIYSTREGNIITDVNLIGLVGSTHGNVDITEEFIRPGPVRPPVLPPISTSKPVFVRTPPPPRVTIPPRVGPTPVTFKSSDTYITLPTLKVQEGGVISFKFRTIKDNGLMFFNKGSATDPNFVAVELYDGKLYFVYDFGSLTRRVLFSPRIVSDGQQHEVQIRFFARHIDLVLNGESKRISFVSGERLTNNLKGAFYVGGFDSFTTLPWYVWSRDGYQGCIQDLRVNGEQVDLHRLVTDQFLYGKVDRRCLSMPRECAVLQPCKNGFCVDTWNGYRCDCRGTSYTGRNCDKDALVGSLNGKQFAVVSMDAPQTHTNDISMRFKTPLKDALLFQTYTDVSNEYLRCELENGRIKVTTNLGGETKSFYVGENLNDFQWHTVYINRRANQLELWVDDGPRTTGELAGERYFFDIEQIFVGGLTDDKVQIGGDAANYIGYMQSFMFNDVSVFDSAARQPGDNLITLNLTDINRLPPLIYNPVTIKNREAYVTLSTLRIPQSMAINFMFKTKETSGVILFNGGRNREFIAVELYNGYLHFSFNTSDSAPALRMNTPQPLNDNKWHTVSIRRVDDRRFSVSIDGSATTIASEGQDTSIDLQGPLYIGGLPQRMFDQPYINSALLSKSGFQGCLASIDLSGAVPDLLKYSTNTDNMATGCTEIQSVCVANTCSNYGICVPEGGLFRCDCNMTSYVGTICNEEALGFRIKESGSRNGALIYSYSQGFEPSTMADDIAFGFMTNEENGLLMRVNSALVGDFIELRLVDGHIVAEYDTDSSGKSSKIVQSSRKFNDGKYHVVRFYRTSNNATLRVDDLGARINSHAIRHGIFDKHGTIHVGGHRVNNVVESPFNGIIAGMYFNGLRVLDMAGSKRQTAWIGDVAIAPHPFSLSGSTIKVITQPPNVKPPFVTVAPIRPTDPVVIPPGGGAGGGGGGIIWPPGGTGSLTSGGTGGSGILLTGAGSAPVAAASVGSGAGGAGGGFATGPRAGAVLGTVLGVLAFASSMMWAFYLCKPGWCTGLKPGAGGAAPVAISPPRPGSNLGAVKAATGLGAGAGAGGPTISSEAAGAGGTVNYDTATLRGTGTFTSSGTNIGTPTATRAHLGSSSSYYQQNTLKSGTSMVDGGANLGSPVTLGSYNYEGHGMADYDLAHGVGGSNYQSNTLQSGYSASTMTMYNYNMQNVRTVTGQHQMMGYAGQNFIPPTPGAMGEEVRVDCCLMTRDGSSVVTGSSHGPPQCWDMQSGELLRTMQGYTMGSTNLHLACNDRMLVGAVNADLEINEYSVRKGVTNRQLQIWDFTNGQPLEMSSLIEYCSALCVMSDNDKVVFARTDKFGNATAVVVWDIMGNQPIKEMRYDSPVGNNDYVHYLNLSQNDRYVIAGFTNTFDNHAEFVVFDMTLTSYNVMEPSFLRLDANPEVTEVLPRDEAVTGLRNGDLVVWSLRNGQPSRQLVAPNGRSAHDREVKAIARSKDNKYLVSASADGLLKTWDLETERQLTTMSGHQDEVWCCAISPDNDIIVSGSRDGTIRLWQLRNGKQICSFNAGVDVFYITMSQDKSTIVALGDKYGARKLIMLQIVRTKVRRQIKS